MSKFESIGGVKIAFDDVGEGDPILLLHGFAADSRLNWTLSGWYKSLNHAGFRVIAMDSRGHGRSDKPTDKSDYAPEVIAADIIGLLDHLSLKKVDLFGYSMGGRQAAWMISRYPRRFTSVVIGGVGINLLQVDDPEYWTNRGFNLTADNQKSASLAIPGMVPLYEKAAKIGGRLGALSACLMGSFPSLPATDFARNKVPVLVIAGSRDTVSGSPIPLAESIPGARAVIVPGKSHLSIVNDEFFRGAVLGFLGCRWKHA